MKTKTKNSAKGGSASMMLGLSPSRLMSSGGKTVRSKKTRVKHYEPHYLALVLVAFLLLEGITITSTSTTDWHKGTEVLDISKAFADSVSDMTEVFQPIVNTISDLQKFYELSATETIPLLDLSDYDATGEISLITGGVAGFYQEASIQLAELFNFSSATSWSSSVAGASATTY